MRWIACEILYCTDIHTTRMPIPVKNILSLFLALTIGLGSACQSGRKPSPAASPSLKIISHNLWYGFTKVPERKEAWMKWIRVQDPDIVSLQELNGFTGEALAALAASYGHSYSVLLKEEGFPTGLTSRYPIEDTLVLRQGFHHGLLRARIQGIYFYVIHLHPSNWKVRQAEIQLVLDDMKALPPETPVILAGDFNTFSPQDASFYAHGRLEPFFRQRDSLYAEENLNQDSLDYSVIGEVLDAGLVDLEAEFRDPGYSFTGSFPTGVEKEGEHGDARRLDYVFASSKLARKVTRAAILANDTTWLLSDHLPVLVTLELDGFSEL